MPIISVIIPAYNAEKTIKETIQSVLNQTWQDFELLIINDGSQDATLEVIESIQDPRIKIFSYPNAGSSASRNRGIAIAKGEYISFIDADDLWTADKLEAQYKALQENSQAAVAYSWTDHIDESGQFLRSGPQQSFTGDVYARLLLEDFIGNGSNPLIRAQAFAEVGDFDESLAHSEDWDLWLRLAARYHFVAVPSPQILYRMSC
jgi:glycosyltransferase involved in cell wall biosynthesis